MRDMSLVLVGFGNVGQALAELLLRKEKIMAEEYGLKFKITGIATVRHGMASDENGLNITEALRLAKAGQSLNSISKVPQPSSIIDFIDHCPGSVMFENSPVNHHTGQPAIDHCKAAIKNGMHVVTANKGTVVHGYRELLELASVKGRRFMFESTVMDGAPIFSLFRGPLPLVDLKGFKGILNSCTNLLLEMMEQGKTFEEAVEYGKSIGITETDPSADIDGWDAAIKVAALSTVLMGIPLTPSEVDRTGIRGITPAQIADAKKDGKRWKLICTAAREDNSVSARVAPEMVSPLSPFYGINGTSSYCQFETDVLPGLGIVESNPGPETTAYGLLADMINILRGQ
ncbi:MAG: homoserine dehydrogenase [Anaerolineaceae bacterium]